MELAFGEGRGRSPQSEAVTVKCFKFNQAAKYFCDFEFDKSVKKYLSKSAEKEISFSEIFYQ